MVEIPHFEAPLTPEPTPAPTVNPAVAGEAWNAAAEGAERVGDVATQFAQRYADATRAADAAQITANASQHFDDMQHRWSLAVNPASGLPDRDYSEAGFNAEAKQYNDNLLGSISDPLIKDHVSERLSLEAGLRGSDTANAAFQRESQARVGQLAQSLVQQAQSAANASNPLLRAKIVDDASGAIKGAVAAGWLRADEGQEKLINFNVTLSRVDAQKYARDADMAMENGRTTPLEVSSFIADPTHFPGLPAEMRQQLANEAIHEGRSIVGIKASALAHDDAVADKALKAAQQSREVGLLAAIDGGQPVDAAQLAHLGETQQISLGGYEAARAALAKKTTDHDDLPTYDALNRRLMSGEDVGGDILQAQSDGLLSVKTGIALVKANTAKAQGGETAIDKSNFATLKTALGGAAIENGVLDKLDDVNIKSRNVAVWTEAQKEWTQRVIAGRENSNDVLSDMLPRLQPMRADLPAPQMGAIKAAADLANVARATVQAHTAGQMTDAQYQSQVRLLNTWREFMALGGGGNAGWAVLKPAQPQGTK